MFEIGKIFVRSLVGIIVAGVVTILSGETIPVEIMLGLYGMIIACIYMDKDVSGEIPNKQ
jgi:hypothetical protein